MYLTRKDKNKLEHIVEGNTVSLPFPPNPEPRPCTARGINIATTSCQICLFRLCDDCYFDCRDGCNMRYCQSCFIRHPQPCVNGDNDGWGDWGDNFDNQSCDAIQRIMDRFQQIAMGGLLGGAPSVSKQTNPKCTARTPSNMQCKNFALNNQEFCGKHSPKAKSFLGRYDEPLPPSIATKLAKKTEKAIKSKKKWYSRLKMWEITDDMHYECVNDRSTTQK